jgi:hypothetical protein
VPDAWVHRDTRCGFPRDRTGLPRFPTALTPPDV